MKAARLTLKSKRTGRKPNALVRFLKILGPGFVTGASDDDPSGIGTYAQAGASFGLVTLWTALVTFPMMVAVQFICGKIGMVTGRGLGKILKIHYPRTLLYSIVLGLCVANTINVGADIGAIAEAVHLLMPIPARLMVLPIGATILALQLWGSYRLIAKVFKWLALALCAYIGSALFAKPDFHAVLMGTFMPRIHFDSKFMAALVAILGTTISPYLFFWQADQEVEEDIGRGRKTLAQRQGSTKPELKHAAWDTISGMLFSNVVMYFIILSTGATLFKAGKTDIQSATDAAQALRPLAGDGAYILLAIGLIGAGFLAVPILSGSTAYAVCEAFGWKCSLDKKPRGAKQFYTVIAISMLLGVAFNFMGINPMKALFWTAVINGFLAPPLLVVLMLVSNNPDIMGDKTNNRWTNVLSGTTTLVMTAAAIGLIVTWIKP